VIIYSVAEGTLF